MSGFYGPFLSSYFGSFFGTESLISLSKIKGNIFDIIGISDTTEFSVQLNKEIVQYQDVYMVRSIRQKITPNSSGYWEVFLIDTESMNVPAKYEFDFGDGMVIEKSVPIGEFNFYELE